MLGAAKNGEVFIVKVFILPIVKARAKPLRRELELELELIQSHMAQKPVLRGEVGCACVAREVSVERGQRLHDMSQAKPPVI